MVLIYNKFFLERNRSLQGSGTSPASMDSSHLRLSRRSRLPGLSRRGRPCQTMQKPCHTAAAIRPGESLPDCFRQILRTRPHPFSSPQYIAFSPSFCRRAWVPAFAGTTEMGNQNPHGSSGMEKRRTMDARRESTLSIGLTCSGGGCSGKLWKTLPYGFFSSITRVSMISSTLKSLKFCRPIPHS